MVRSSPVNAIELLRAAVGSYEPYLQPSGELHDPVLREPTRAGTPYHALSQAVLACRDPEPGGSDHLMNAFHGLDASLRFLLDPDHPSPASRLDPATGAVAATQPRAFFWAPVLKTYRILKQQGVAMAEAFTHRIGAVDATRHFPHPTTQAGLASWLEGEWIRIQEGLGGLDRGAFDRQLISLLDSSALVEAGYCQQPGQANACDLLIRLHLTGLLLADYDGAARNTLEALMTTGLQRSLAVQLSDGSLASAHEHGGQTWTAAAQLAYFARVGQWTDDRGAADTAARLALASLQRWLRSDEPFSPVENIHPPSFRIGYDEHTLDGHYGSFAVSLLAEAVLNGFEGEPLEIEPDRPLTVFIESDPVQRALVHGGPYSVHVNASPHGDRDTFGLADITFGPQRFFHLVGAVHHSASGRIFTPGMALREQPGRSEVRPITDTSPRLIAPMEPGRSDAGLHARARCPGAMYPYELDVWISDDGIEFEENTPGWVSHKTLLLPFPRDLGGEYRTHVRIALSPEGAVVRFRYGQELVRLRVRGAISHSLVLPHGYESRRGLCGMLRLDLRDPTETLRYRMTVGR